MLRRYILPVMVPSRRTSPPGPPPCARLANYAFRMGPVLILILNSHSHPHRRSSMDQTSPVQSSPDQTRRIPIYRKGDSEKQGSFHAKTRSGAHHTHAQSTRPACCLGNETGLGTKAARPVTRHDWSTGIPHLFYLYVKQLTWSGILYSTLPMMENKNI